MYTQNLSTNGHDTFKTFEVFERISMKQFDAVFAANVQTLRRTFKYSSATNLSNNKSLFNMTY